MSWVEFLVFEWTSMLVAFCFTNASFTGLTVRRKKPSSERSVKKKIGITPYQAGTDPSILKQSP